ncbi:uncharacterized protein [Nicotiana sylvestris]|uniref:uncharacterized protein n=1 Tax=Nicotiana sylvestris TaxID=4096 RepID=UPI00388C42DB
MEYLSRVLKTMSNLPDFLFHPICKTLKLTHLIFVDDLMIYCKGNLPSVARVVEALNHFSEVSGLVANLDKSSMFIAGVDDATKDQLLATTGFIEGTFPIRYVGLPLSSKKEYLWGSTEEKKKLALVAWKRIRSPKKYGGLNMKGSKLWNVAVVGKLLWQPEADVP